MPFIVLAKSSEPNGTEKAQARLKALIDDPLTVLTLIGGEGSEAHDSLEMAVSVASAKPAIRRVVWVPDKTVLSADQLANFFPQGVLLCSVGIEDRVAETLSPKKAKIRSLVEHAFLAAEAQT